MGKASSRTYKLRLSDQGVDLFLACHHRLAQLVREFIPYGTTLSVAVLLLERLDADEVAAEFGTSACQASAGDQVRFVGCSTELADVMARVCERLTASDRFGQSPPIGRLYLVGLATLRAAEDKELREAYHSVVGQKPKRRVKKLVLSN
jgi:hypothetical protein